MLTEIPTRYCHGCGQYLMDSEAYYCSPCIGEMSREWEEDEYREREARRDRWAFEVAHAPEV